jgi:hypothetical protein
MLARPNRRKRPHEDQTMTPFKIPESAYAAIQHLVHLSETDFAAFLDALTRAEPSLKTDMFWSHVAPHVKQIEPPVIKSILNEIFSMDAVRTDEPLDEFAEAMAEAASEIKSKEFPFRDEDRKTLKDRLVKILEGRKGLEITMKSAGVMLDQERVFYHARILTDIRPVFDSQGESVSAAVIVHNLRIHYEHNSEHEDFHVALDTADIQSLREVLDRAEKKASYLKGLLGSMRVSYLDAEE